MSASPVRYHDPFVTRLYDAIGAMIEGDAVDRNRLVHDLIELAACNSPAVREYWRRTERGQGVPDAAFRTGSLFHFKDTPPVRVFRTSGTSKQARGVAEYSQRGLDLMRRSVIAGARRHVFSGLDQPTVLRLVPDATHMPDNIMAYGMALLSDVFGHRGTSASIAGPDGIDTVLFIDRLNRAIAERRPVVMIGGSFAFVHLSDYLAERRLHWVLPEGSRIVDAGGFKGRSRDLDVDALRNRLASIFAIPSTEPDTEQDTGFSNIFGMTELAGQLYDSSGMRLGPKGERPKRSPGLLAARVRNPLTWRVCDTGPGLLEVTDLCILDRPCAVLTGDWGIACPEGIAVTGRIAASESRGCALALESSALLQA